MELLTSYPAQISIPAYLKVQRTLLAASIILGPLSVTLFVLSWPANLREPIVASAMAGTVGNMLHFIGAIPAALAMLKNKDLAHPAPPPP